MFDIKVAIILNVLAFIIMISISEGKRFEECELARRLKQNGFKNIGVWLCIVDHESRFLTTAKNSITGDYGLFQISQLYW